MPILRGVSALLGILTVLCVYGLGTMLFDRRAGLWSGLVWATGLVAVYELRYARHDIYLTAFVALTMLGGWRVLRRQPGGWGLLGLGLVLSFQSKGPVSWGLTVLPLIGYLGVYERDRWTILPGVVLAMAVATLSLLPWAIAMQREMPLDLVPVYLHETVGRFRSEQVKGYAPYHYLAYLGYVFPWTVGLISALAWPGRRPAPADRGRAFAWMWLVVGLVFLSLAKEKRTRYGVPLLAPGALLIGGGVAASLRAAASSSGWRPHRPLAWAHIGLLAAAAVAAPVALIVRRALHPAIAVAAGAVLIALTLRVRAWLTGGRPGPAAAGTAGYAVVLILVLVGAQATAPTYREPLRELARPIAEIVGTAPFFSWTQEKPPHQLIYYVNRAAPEIAHPLYLALRHPELSYNDLVGQDEADDTRSELRRWALADYLRRVGGDQAYALCDAEGLDALRAIAAEGGFAAEPVLDITTRRARSQKQRPARYLVGLSRIDAAPAPPGVVIRHSPPSPARPLRDVAGGNGAENDVQSHFDPQSPFPRTVVSPRVDTYGRAVVSTP